LKHTCNDDNDIDVENSKKLDYRIFTCKFTVSYLQCQQIMTL